MVNFKVGNYRGSTGYRRYRLSIREIQGLNASGNLDDELWALVEFYSESEDFGLDFLKGIGISNSIKRKKIYKHFQAYIRQAKGYYYSAKTLLTRSSPLLYYYCFMNLAMAFLVINEPAIIDERLNHGISRGKSIKLSFDKHNIQVHEKGVFPRLYKNYFGKNIPTKPLNISTLFNYCTDIGYQCVMAGINEDKILYCKYSHCVDNSGKIAWPLIAIISTRDILRYPKCFINFISNYEEVNLPQHSCMEIFNIDAYQQIMNFKFFQSIKTEKWLSDKTVPFFEVNKIVIDTFKNVFQVNYFPQDWDFALSLPYKIKNQIQLDETIAIYLIMFYLSDIVRYKPHYMESLLNKKEAWLIECFSKFCPLTFLRSMISRITITDYILDRR